MKMSLRANLIFFLESFYIISSLGERKSDRLYEEVFFAIANNTEGVLGLLLLN